MEAALALGLQLRNLQTGLCLKYFCFLLILSSSFSFCSPHTLFLIESLSGICGVYTFKDFLNSEIILFYRIEN